MNEQYVDSFSEKLPFNEMEKLSEMLELWNYKMSFSYESQCAQAMHCEAYYRVRSLARWRQPLQKSTK